MDICSTADIFGVTVNAGGGIHNIGDVCKGLACEAVSLINKMEKITMNFKSYYWEYIKLILLGLAIFIAVGLTLSIPLWLLWNWLMPHIFGLPTINILEAFGLSALITLLAPRPLDLNNKQKTNAGEAEEKLEKVLQDITSHFQA